MSNRGPGSDDSTEATNFPVRANEYYIDFTPTSSQAVTSMDYFVKFGPNFSVDKDGVLFASGAVFEGKITSSAGQIGGWAIEDDVLRAASNAMILSGSGVISSSKFFVDEQGNLTASSGHFTGTVTASRVESDSGRVSGWVLNTGYLADSNNKIKLQPEGLYVISSSNFQVNSDGDVTGSSALFNGDINVTGTGTIAGFGLTAAAISSSNDNLILKSSGQITGSTALFTGGKIGGFTISSTQLSGGSSGTTVALTPGTGIHMGNASFASAPFSVTNAGVLKAESGTIGGWTLSSSTISSNNLTISSAGLIETNDFASGVKGFRLTAADGGSAEFEQVTIRGTLKTTVFEKESVNAVGGQLYVANSTTITGSSEVGASDTTIQVANASGFAAGEVLSVKKVTATGFSTEYMKVHSVAREDSSSDSNFSGSLVVTRSLSSGASGPSGSLGEAPGSGQSYGPGQVLVSTGKLGTGYIRINANPNDSATPYIDIVERTGSGTFDVDLKARLGDLSGLSTERLQGTAPTSAGFGLYSQNVFLEGGIIANTGSIAGVEMRNNQLFIGDGDYYDSDTPFYVSGKSDATAGDFSLGNKLKWDASTSTLTIAGQITLESGGDTVPDAAAISGSFGAASSSFATRQDAYETQFILDSSGATLFDTSGPNVVSKFGSSIHLNKGDIFVGVTGSEHVKVSSTGVELKDGESTVYGKFAATSTFGQTGTSTPFVEIASGVIKIKNSSHTFVSASSAGLFTSGSINADKGVIGGFKIGQETLTGQSGSFDTIRLNTNHPKAGSALEAGGDLSSNVDLTIGFGSSEIGAGSKANKTHISASNADIVFNTKYGKDFYFTPGRVRQWHITPAGGHDSDPSSNKINSFSFSGIQGAVNYDAGIVGISSNLGGNMNANEVNAAILGWNSRGATGAPCVGVHGLVNRGNVAGVLGEVYGYSSDDADPAENLISGMFRGGPMIVGNAFTASLSDVSNDSVDYTLIAYPRTKYGMNYENRVGINQRVPGYALDVTGDIYATGNVTAYSDRRSKKNIEFISGSLNLVNQMRGVYYDWKKPEEIAPDRYGKYKTRPMGKQVGMIAQEVQKVIPELVDENIDSTLSLKYSNLVGVLVNAVNELSEKVDKQEKQIKELQSGKN